MPWLTHRFGSLVPKLHELSKRNDPFGISVISTSTGYIQLGFPPLEHVSQ